MNGGEGILTLNPLTAVIVFLAIALVFALCRPVPRRLAHASAGGADAKLSNAKLDEILVHQGEIEERLRQCEHDGKNVRQVVQELPTKAAVRDLSERISAVSTQVEAMASGQFANTRSLARIEDFLLEAAVDHIVKRRAGTDAGKGQE